LSISLNPFPHHIGSSTYTFEKPPNKRTEGSKFTAQFHKNDAIIIGQKAASSPNHLEYQTK